MAILFILVFIVLVTLVGIFVAHWLYRILYLGRRYPGASIAEDVFILLFTAPSVAGAGYAFVILPIGISLLLSAGLFIWFGEWPRDEPFFSMNNLVFSEWPRTATQWGNLLSMVFAWLATVIAVALFRRRNKAGSEVDS